MPSTHPSILKRIADSFGINMRFSRRGHDSIDHDPRHFISPVDATLFHHGGIDDEGNIISKHGRRIPLSDLVGKHSRRFARGYYLNLYLSPNDKHYFLMPYGGKIEYVQKNECRIFIPIIIGLDNWFGNHDWFSRAAKQNASIGVVVNSGSFRYGMIAVGSLNVNHITMDCMSKRTYFKADYAGHFAVGSTMILCFDRKITDRMKLLIRTGEHISIGRPIAKI